MIEILNYEMRRREQLTCTHLGPTSRRGQRLLLRVFLRALLDSLRIGVELLGTSLEDQLERSLSKETPEELISFLLGQWTAYFDPDSSENTSQGILCWVLSLLYVSRHGLSDEEIEADPHSAGASRGRTALR